MASAMSSFAAIMRSELVAMLTQSALIERPEGTPDGRGGKSKTWSTVATVDCHLEEEATTIEGEFGSRVLSVGEMLLHVPTGTDIRAKDRATVDGALLSVEFVPPVLGQEIMRPVVVKYLK